MVYRPGTADATDPEFVEALAVARQDPELHRWFEEHCATHRAIRTRFKEIAAPDGLKGQILSEFKMRRAMVWWKTPIEIAAVAALILILIGAVLWFRPESEAPEGVNFATFRGRMVAAVLRNYRMTLETADAREVRAHLAQNNAPANYTVPASLERLPLVGCGLLSWQDKPVSMLCFRSGKPLEPFQKSDVFLFVVDEKAMPDPPHAKAPEIRAVKKFVTASWTADGKIYVLATEGDEALIRSYL